MNIHLVGTFTWQGQIRYDFRGVGMNAEDAMSKTSMVAIV